MKKFITTTSTIATILLSSNALAKTSGSYAEIDLLGSYASHKYTRNDVVARNYSTFDDSAVGYGASYKYAFNFKNIFVAPGIFFDQIGTKATDKDGDNVSINNRCGFKIDAGYDFTDKFAAYFTNGLSVNKYEVNWKSVDEKKSGSKAAYFIGTGAIFHVTQDITTNVEYNFQRLNAATPTSGGINNARSDLHVMKIGVAYHF